MYHFLRNWSFLNNTTHTPYWNSNLRPFILSKLPTLYKKWRKNKIYFQSSINRYFNKIIVVIIHRLCVLALITKVITFFVSYLSGFVSLFSALLIHFLLLHRHVRLYEFHQFVDSHKISKIEEGITPAQHRYCKSLNFTRFIGSSPL